MGPYHKIASQVRLNPRTSLLFALLKGISRLKEMLIQRCDFSFSKFYFYAVFPHAILFIATYRLYPTIRVVWVLIGSSRPSGARATWTQQMGFSALDQFVVGQIYSPHTDLRPASVPWSLRVVTFIRLRKLSHTIRGSFPSKIWSRNIMISPAIYRECVHKWCQLLLWSRQRAFAYFRKNGSRSALNIPNDVLCTSFAVVSTS